jgi:cation:H+ antiporter
MNAALTLIGWFAAVLTGVAAMHWGSGRACRLLGYLRRIWGLPATAGGVFLGMATASPEISINIASVAFGWPDIGLGAALGSNVPALPLIFGIAYVSVRLQSRKSPAPTEAPRVPVVASDAVPVQVLPYLAIVALLGLLSLPPPWRGLQPIDGLILGGAFLLYLLHAFRRGREPDPCSVPRGEIAGAAAGLIVIAFGAVLAVLAARHINEALGLSDLVGGLYIVGLLCALPESFAAWRLSREGKTTTAVSGAVADGIVSLTLAMLPLCIVHAEVGDGQLYLLNLAFISLVLIIYIATSNRFRGQHLEFGRVAAIFAAYTIYIFLSLRMIT